MEITINAGDTPKFAAQIKNTLSNDWLAAEDVASITYTVYKVTTTFGGRSLTAVSGHSNISVPLTAVLEQPVTSDYWTLDTTGYNFLHCPDSTSVPAFGDPDTAYRIVYRFVMTAGNPFVLAFDVYTS